MKKFSRSSVATVAGGLLWIGLILIGVIFFAGFWKVGSNYQVSAYVSNARGIAKYSNVFEAGLPVGLVTGVKRNGNGPDAILTLRIDKGVM